MGQYQPLPNVFDLAQEIASATLQLPEADRAGFLAARRKHHYEVALQATHDPQAAAIWVEMLHKRIDKTMVLLAASPRPEEAATQVELALKVPNLESLRRG